MGLSEMTTLGSAVDSQRPLAVDPRRVGSAVEEGYAAVKAAITLSDRVPQATPVVYHRISE